MPATPLTEEELLSLLESEFSELDSTQQSSQPPEENEITKAVNAHLQEIDCLLTLL